MHGQVLFSLIYGPRPEINIAVGHWRLAEQYTDMDLHRHYERPFCLIYFNISSFIIANLFNKFCNL
jgi:hypothetical protein